MLLITHQRTLISFLFTASVVHQPSREVMPLSDPYYLRRRTDVKILVDTANIRIVLSTNHVDSRSFSSRCWAFRGTHSSADPIRLLCIRIALALSLPSGFVPSTELMVGASPRALGLVKGFPRDCMFWNERGGGLAPVGPRVNTTTIKQY